MRCVPGVVLAAAAVITTSQAASSTTHRQCRASFAHTPGIRVKTVAFTVGTLPGGHASAAATTCARGEAVIQAGFTRYGTKALDYHEVGKLEVVVAGTRYSLAYPRPLASGSHAWKGGSTMIQYSLPTGP